jgi:hypothetical protein
MAITIAEFCWTYKISIDDYLRMQRDGDGPREMKLSEKVVRISVEAVEEWQLEYGAIPRPRKKAAGGAGASE